MNKPVSNTTAVEQRLEGSIDKEKMSLTNVSSAVGGLAFEDMGQVMEFSKLMAVSRQAVPKHLRGEAGACMAVSLQALNWRMDPFAVANKSYMVNDRIAYEAQLIHAVIEQRAPITGRIKGEVSGEGQTRKWTLTANTTDGDQIVFEGNEIGKITTKNSPLWKSDPDQQLWFYSVRAMCRRHFPDVLLGVYEKEEINHSAPLRDVTPQQSNSGWAAKADAAREPEPEVQNQATDEPEIEDATIIPDDDEGEASHWTDDVPQDEGMPGSDAWNDGMQAFANAAPITDCPHEDDMEAAQDWMGGYHGAQKAAE